MSQQGKSTPKMRRAYTPRVKSAHKEHDHPLQKPAFFTSQKPHQNQATNPQQINMHIEKKLNINFNNIGQQPNRVDKVVLNTQNNEPLVKKFNNFTGYKHSNKNIEVHKATNPKYGRNLNWNAKQAPNNQISNPNQKQLKQRSQSAQTLRSYTSNTYMNSAQKSQKIIQDKKEFQQKFNVAFDYLLKSNSAYLNERLSTCNQKSRPKQQILKINRPPQNTSNKDFFSKNSNKYHQQIEPQNLKDSLLKSSKQVCANSLSKQAHSGKNGEKSNLATWTQGFKLQGPMYDTTTSKNAYPNHGQFEKMVPIASFNQHPKGMPHKGQSTNKRLMKGLAGSKSNKATWNNLNPLGNDFNHSKSSLYNTAYGFKQKQPIQQWPLYDSKVMTTKGKFNTQYKDNLNNFNDHELAVQNHCNCGRKRH